MALDEIAPDAAIAILRLARKIEALEAEVKTFKEAERKRDLQRAVQAAKKPTPLPKGDKGDPGDKGDRGPPGPMPNHKWQGTKLSFQKPDGRYGLAIDLQGPSGSGGVVSGGGGRSIAEQPESKSFTYLGGLVTQISGASKTVDLTYNLDGTVDTVSDGLVTKEFTYNPDGTIAEISVT